jgi:hypothetical protein
MELLQMSRSMLFRCQLCGADIAVYDDTTLVTCEGCQAESVVERRHGTIALRILPTPTKTTKSEKKVTSAWSLGQLTKQLAIALRILPAPTKTTKSEKKLTGALSLGQLTKQLVELRQESSTIRSRKIAVAIVGGICGILFGYMVNISWIGKDFGPGVAMLLCVVGAFWFVRFVRASAVSASRIKEKIEEIELQIAERQKFDIQRLAASERGLD